MKTSFTLFFALLLVSFSSSSQNFAETPPPQQPDYQKIQFGLSGGFSYLTGSVPETYDPGIQRYLKELKSGTHYGADFSYFFNKYIGIGAKYTAFRTRNSLDGVMVFGYNNNPITHGSIKDNILVHFAGPSFVTRVLSTSQRTALTTAVSLGYVHYKNDAMLIESFTLRGSTLGLGLEIGPDFYIDQNLSIGFNIGLLMAFLNEIELSNAYGKETTKLSEPENLSRLDLSLNLRWNM